MAFAAEPGTRERTFVRALEVFDAAKTPADYRESAALLESLLADGFRNGAVYYNLGNAYFRAGEYRPVDRGVPQGQAVPPARSVSRGEFAASALGRPGPLARTASPVVEARVVLERLVVVSREGLRVVRGLSAGGPGRRARPCFSAGRARIGSARHS